MNNLILSKHSIENSHLSTLKQFYNIYNYSIKQRFKQNSEIRAMIRAMIRAKTVTKSLAYIKQSKFNSCNNQQLYSNQYYTTNKSTCSIMNSCNSEQLLC